ncbi:LOW QUALITY PROTEIN: hypothetical protein V2J09_020577, partial [Rumex salicifolius]
APPSIFRLPSPFRRPPPPSCWCVLLLLLLRFITLNFSELLKLSREYQILLPAGASSSLHLPTSVAVFRRPPPPSCWCVLLLLPAVLICIYWGSRIGTHPPNVAAVYRYNEQQLANPIGFDLIVAKGLNFLLTKQKTFSSRRMSIANLQRCRRIACALTPKFASTGKLHPGHRRLHNGPDTIEELIDRHLVKEDKSRRDDDDEESEILARRRLTSSRREALSLYRDIIRATRFFAWSDSRGVLWRDVLRENARSEFEAAKYEKDPEVITRLLIGGRDAVHQALEKLAEKQRQQLQKGLGQTL